MVFRLLLAALLVFMCVCEATQGAIIDFESTGLPEGTVLSSLPSHPEVSFSGGILILPGQPRFGFNGSSAGGPGGIDSANSGATYSAPDSDGDTVSVAFLKPVTELSFDAVDIDNTGSSPETVTARVYDAEVGGTLLGTRTISSGDPGAGDGLLVAVTFDGLAGIRRLEFEGVPNAGSTPGYAVDNIAFVVIPEPTSLSLLLGVFIAVASRRITLPGS